MTTERVDTGEGHVPPGTGSFPAGKLPAEVLAACLASMPALAQANIHSAAIARVVPQSQGIRCVTANGEPRPLPVFARDEVARLLESAPA